MSQEYLRSAADSPSIRRIKARALELLELREGLSVLDVGCGPATDTTRLGQVVGPTGSVVGVDASAEMIAAAEHRALAEGVSAWTRHQRASATALPFAAGTFDRCHSERLLQHLPERDAATSVHEMHRVTRPGGRIVIVDTDWATLSVDSPNPWLERLLVAGHVAQFQNGTAGRQLFRHLRHAGFVRVRAETCGVTLNFPTVEFLLRPAGYALMRAGQLGYAQWQQWCQQLYEASTLGSFFAHAIMVIASGTRT